MLSLSLTVALKWAAILSFSCLAIIAAVDLLTMSQPRRIRVLTRSGLSQRAIASRLNVSRYRVRMALS